MLCILFGVNISRINDFDQWYYNIFYIYLKVKYSFVYYFFKIIYR